MCLLLMVCEQLCQLLLWERFPCSSICLDPCQLDNFNWAGPRIIFLFNPLSKLCTEPNDYRLCKKIFLKRGSSVWSELRGINLISGKHVDNVVKINYCLVKLLQQCSKFVLLIHIVMNFVATPWELP